jgi:outer membrane protein assembly factor BamB
MRPVAILMHGGRLARALAVVLVAHLAVAAAPAPDPIEGKWFGEAGTPRDRVGIGLEFRRNVAGELKAFLYQPVINFYGLELPGIVQASGQHYRLDEYALAMDLRQDALEGAFSSLKVPLRLTRTDSLPAEVPIPDLPRGPEPLWQVKLGAPIYATAALRDGIAYVGTEGGVFHAVNIADGSIAWAFSAGRPMYGEAAVTDDAVYFTCDNGYLFRLDRRSGKEAWRYDLGDSRVERILPHPTVFGWDYKGPRPLIAGGVIYVGSGDGSLHAVRASTGRRVWRFQPPPHASRLQVGGSNLEQRGKVRADAVIDAGRVIFGSFDGFVYAVDRSTGVELWEKNTSARIGSPPVVINGKLLIGNYGSLLAALDPANGSVLWRLIWWGSAVESTPVAFGGLAYIGASDLRRVTCFDAAEGRVLWRTDVYGWAWAAPAVTDDYIYVGVAGGSPYYIRHVGSLTAIDRRSSAIAWRRPAPESGFVYGYSASPSIEGHTLVIGGLDGTLSAFPVP